MVRPLQRTARVRWWQSLVGRAVLAGGLSLVLVLAVVVGHETLRNRRMVTRAVTAQMALVAQAKDDDVNGWIETQRDILTVVAGSSTARRWAEGGQIPTALDTGENAPSEAQAAYEELVHLLFLVTREHAGVREVSVLRAPNGLIAASSNATRIGQVRGSEVYYVQGLQGSYVGRAQMSGTTGRSVMVLSTPLHTQSGALAGVVVMELDIDWMQRTKLGRTAFASGWERHFVDRSFNLLVGPGAGPAQRPMLWSGAVEMFQSDEQLQGGSSGAGTYRNYRDQQVIGAYHWIESMDLALLIETNLADAMSEASPGIFMGSIVAGTLMVGLLVAGAWLAGRKVARPLTQLDAQMMSVAEGESEWLDDDSAVRSSGIAEIQGLVTAFREMGRQLDTRREALETQVTARTEDLRRRSLQLQAAVGVSSAVAAIRDVQELIDETVRLIPGYFDFDHVGIFLKDERGEAVVLRAASSEDGKRMLAREYRLLLGQGIVGTVAQEGSARIALDVGEAGQVPSPGAGPPAGAFDNPHLPNTRSEMALPLIVRSPRDSVVGPRVWGTSSRYGLPVTDSAGASGLRVLGVLDVQSEQPGAFTDEDVIVFQSVADQVALAIENARLLEESDLMLRELQTRYGEQIVADWKRPLISIGNAYRYTQAGLVTPVSGEHADAGGAESAELLEPSCSLGPGGERELLAPIVVRGQVLGSIMLRQDTLPGTDQEPWDEESLALVSAVCGHIGEALENARLLHEAQVRVGYEQLTGNIAERIRSSAVDVDEILRTTLQELGATLGAKGTIKLQAISRKSLHDPEAGNGGQT